MDGGASYPPSSQFTRIKPNDSNMTESHRASSPSSLFLPQIDRPHDEHYETEHTARRRRLHLPTPPLRFAGDGFDFRRPAMSASSTTRGVGSMSGSEEGRRQQRLYVPETIDLTDEREEEEQQADVLNGGLTSAPRPETGTETVAGSSRAQRLPRFERNIIDIASSDEEDEAEQRAHVHAHAQSRPRSQSRDRHLQHDQPRAPTGSLVAFLAQRARPTHTGPRRDTERAHTPAMMGDIEFVASRPVSRAQSRTATRPSTNGPRSVTPLPGGAQMQIDLTEEEDDDVIISGAHVRRQDGINADRPGMAGATSVRDAAHDERRGVGAAVAWLRTQDFADGFLNSDRLVARIGGLLGIEPGSDLTDPNVHQTAMQARHRQLQRQREILEQRLEARRRQMTARPGQTMEVPQYNWQRPIDPFTGRPRALGTLPNMMDYEMPGFDLGIEVERPKTPEYMAPTAAEDGFTRSPEEDEVVVCPNCGDELATVGDEVKQQVWVIKGCGHAYCGECTKHRLRPTSRKGKARAVDPALPPPFRKCVVADCGKGASAKAMIHVYMSS